MAWVLRILITLSSGKHSLEISLMERRLLSIHLYQEERVNITIIACFFVCQRLFNNYWTGLSKISWFVSVSQINYLPQPSASANNWPARHWQITIIVLLFDHQVCFHIWITLWQLREAIRHFPRKNVGKITHEQNIVSYLQPNTVRLYCAWANHYL